MINGFVYFIRPVGLPGPIKIGFTKCTKVRLGQLAEWSPVSLEIVAFVSGTSLLERNIQDCLWRSHSHHEWFFPTSEVTLFLDKVLAGVPVECAIDLTDNSHGKALRMRKLTRRGKRATPLRQWRWKSGPFSDRPGLPMSLDTWAKVLGLSASALSMIESGKRTPSLSLAARLSELTGISIVEFANSGAAK